MKIRYVEVVSLFGIDCWLARSSFILSSVGFIVLYKLTEEASCMLVVCLI